MVTFRAGVRRVALLAPAAALAVLLPTPAHAEVAADRAPDGVSIEVVTAIGSGCKPGTVKTNVDGDNNGFRAYFDDLAAITGESTQPTAGRRNCQFNVRVSGVPEGYQYAISDPQLRGYGYLAPGATGLARTSFYFQGSSETVTREHKYDGPFNDFFSARDRGPTAWSPCNAQRNANINVELRVSPNPDNTTPISFMSMASWERRVFARFRLAWRSC